MALISPRDHYDSLYTQMWVTGALRHKKIVYVIKRLSNGTSIRPPAYPGGSTIAAV